MDEDGAFRALSEAVLAITAELSLDRVLEQLAHAARSVANARYAAIGVPDGSGGFATFVTSGMTDKQWDALGELPRTHGLLGAMLEVREPYRTDDIQRDPRFEGWPAEHPNMKSFLGVPIVSKGTVVGAFYLTDKKGSRRRTAFTDEDQGLIETLAAHAAIALENARLYERSRELTVVEERNRLARELHDAVSQRLFGLSLTAEAAGMLVDSDPARAKQHIAELQELARGAIDEMRSLIFELRPADLGTEGLVPTLRKHADVLRRVHGTPVEVEVVGDDASDDPVVGREVFRIAQEALGNALRHARASSVHVRLEGSGERVMLTVSDDGVGFDPGAAPAASRRLGLVSMRERAEGLGGTLTVESSPGAGTTVRLEVGRGRDGPRADR